MQGLRAAIIAGRRSHQNRVPEAKAQRPEFTSWPDFLVLVKVIDSVSLGSNRWRYTGREAWVKSDETYDVADGYRDFTFTNPAEGGNTSTTLTPGNVDASSFPGTYALKPLSGYGLIWPTRGNNGDLRWVWVCGCSNVDGAC